MGMRGGNKNKGQIGPTFITYVFENVTSNHCHLSLMIIKPLKMNLVLSDDCLFQDGLAVV